MSLTYYYRSLHVQAWTKHISADSAATFTLFRRSVNVILQLLEDPALAEHSMPCVTALQISYPRTLKQAIPDYQARPFLRNPPTNLSPPRTSNLTLTASSDSRALLYNHNSSNKTTQDESNHMQKDTSTTQATTRSPHTKHFATTSHDSHHKKPPPKKEQSPLLFHTSRNTAIC